ncbi:MAG: FAD-binding protein [Rhodococcus sp. (in: high G+C Gram-positive bacteria)]|uniref:FAD-binding oxidoreductase n=1 Tax=Rhodococcus sp. TaxID=1831 RepID=UPI002AD96F76|nr:FAD-binding protein [Rhodococcus sp. (in: high G+C Gram-positive bacteria)]MDZ7933207.1 FAD-binding protein [Rhodococcus sp. (in: high G+C Gram-positive bacteria)]
MPKMSRRHLLFGAAAVAGAAMANLRPMSASADPLVAPSAGAELIPSDPEFVRLVQRGYNPRFLARPDTIFVPTNTEETVAAVQKAVQRGQRIAVRSGGHCVEDFVDNAHTQVIIDLNRLTAVEYDPQLGAFSVGAGADLGTVYEQLYRRWGVSLPGGSCLGVGMGGHATGGGFGPLSRQFGTVVDHLYGVELVVVDADGRASSVLATRDGPNSDLWWAHTGGGGGNFGVVTRYLLRSHDAVGADPAQILPTPPTNLLMTQIVLPVVSEDAFVRFVGNFQRFFERNSEPGSRFASLYAQFFASAHLCQLTPRLSADLPDARALLDEFIAALGEGVWPAPVVVPASQGPFLDVSTQLSAPRAKAPFFGKYKSANLRRAHTDDQLRTLHRYLSDPRFQSLDTGIELFPAGGAINTRDAGETAMPTRNSFMKAVFVASWRNPADEAANVEWARTMYRDIYADTGGVPIRDDANAGAYINYPDSDLKDPAWNTSGVPWSTLYYGDNYPRLQEIKGAWDPGNLFRHEMSIELPGT